MMHIVKSAIKKTFPKSVVNALYKAMNISTYASKGPHQSKIQLSLVIAAHNSELYLDRMLASIFGQTSALDRFEIIVVDDGSSDRTGEIIQSWSRRYPTHIRHLYQGNSGAGAARNSGIDIAQGDWIGFPDSDDFLDLNYFKKMFEEIRKPRKEPLLALFSNMIIYNEDEDSFSDSHPLRYRFQAGVVRKPSHDLGKFIQMTTNTAWVHRPTLEKHGIRFDRRIVPGFEDAHFINRLLIASPRHVVSFVPKAKYYYRKRADKGSLIDTAKKNPNWFLDQIEFGALSLTDFANERLGKVPEHVQRTCLYELIWKHRYLIDHAERASILSEEQIDHFKHLAAEVFSHIHTDTILKFDLAGCTEEHKVALLSMYKGYRSASPAVYIRDHDPDSGTAQFSYFVGGDDKFTPTVVIDGREVAPILPSQRSTTFLDRTYFRQNFFWVELGEKDKISFEVDGVPCRIRYTKNALGSVTDIDTIRRLLTPQAPNLNKLDDETVRLRDYVLSSRDKFRGGMVLMDREDRADDNAEHLYRFLLQSGRAGGVRFVLSKISRDWDRLRAEGFDLLDFGSDDHIAALLNADVFASSHIDEFVLWPIQKALFKDLACYDFVFLQHGISTNDVSRWLNFKSIRLLVTAMAGEAEAIIDPEGGYTFTSREAIFTGFPRHDTLIARSKDVTADTIAIMPTWRKYLVEPGDNVNARRTKSLSFADSSFRHNWSAFLRSSRLREISQNYGLKVQLIPHPNMAMYLDELDVPDWIESVDVRAGASYQELLARARIAVTDYSSAASEVAYLQRPVVYFQFDADEIMKGTHVYQAGFFDFERDGFGPVVTSPDDALSAIEAAVAGRENPEYALRRDWRFPLRDGQCSKRVVQALDRLAGSKRRHSPLYVSSMEASEVTLFRTASQLEDRTNQQRRSA